MATGFAVAVKIVNLATAPLANINQAIQNLQKSATQVARQGGLYQASAALQKINNQAQSVAQSLAQVFSPLGGLTALGSIGGLALLEERFARTGSEIARTSSALGLSTADLQKWRGAADLAGVGAEAMTSSIAGAAHGIYLMRNGLNPDMFRVVQRWGLDANKGATDAEKGANLILSVAKKIRTDPSLQNNAQAQRTLLGQLGIDERMLWLMQQGDDKMKEFAETSRRHAYLTQEQTNQAMELQFAYNGLQQSVGGFTNAVAAEMSKWMTPTLKGFSDWLDKLRQSPDAMSKVQIGVEALAAVFGVTMVAGIVKLIATLNAFWALPAIRFLLSPLGAGVLAAIAGGYALKGITPPEDAQRWLDEAHKDKSGQAPGFPSWWRGLRNRLFPLQPQFRRHGDWLGVPQGIGATGSEYGTFKKTVAGIEHARYNQMGGSSGRFAGRYQMGPDEIKETAGRLGVPAPTQEEFLSNPAMQERFFDNYTLDHNNQLMASSEKYRNMSPAERLQVLGYAHNQGVGGALRWINTGVAGSDAWGTSGTAYSSAVERALAKAAHPDLNAQGRPWGSPLALPPPALPPVSLPPQVPPSAPGQQGSLNLDSSHRVEIAFNNAPQGMRLGLTRAEGPAEVSVRTHYSMDNLS